MSRDPSAPVDDRLQYRVRRDRCGYATEDHGDAHCGEPSAYQFRMADWPSWRVANTCPVHARLVRTWPGVEWMRSLTAMGR